VSTDTYDETEILGSILKGDTNELYAIALQFSIVGMGKKSLGKVLINDVIADIASLCASNGVITDSKHNSVLLPSQLTPKRLARFFRYHISDYITKTGASSFLYRKYCKVEANPSLVFPCAEYFILRSDSKGLINAYENMDQILGTSFTSRVAHILDARRSELP